MILPWLSNNDPSSVDYYTNIPAGLISERSQDRMIIAKKTLTESIERDFVKSVLFRVHVENGDLSSLVIKLPDR